MACLLAIFAIMAERPVYKVVVDDKDARQGLECVSLVDAPAIEVDFVKLRKHAVEAHRVSLALVDVPKQAQNAARQWVSGPILIPDQKIFRVAEDGEEYDLVYERETIRQLAEQAAQTGALRVLTFDHDGGLPIQAELVETWLSEDPKLDKSAALGYDLPAGTLFVTYKIANQRAWQELIESGRAKGFSIEAVIGLEKVEQKGEIWAERAFWEQKRKSFIKQLKKLGTQEANRHLSKLQDADAGISWLKNNYGKIEDLLAQAKKATQSDARERARNIMSALKTLKALFSAAQEPAPAQVKQQEDGDVFIVSTPDGELGIAIVGGLAYLADTDGQLAPAGVHEGMKLLEDGTMEAGFLTVDESGVPSWSTEAPIEEPSPEEQLQAQLQSARQRLGRRVAAASMAQRAQGIKQAQQQQQHKSAQQKPQPVKVEQAVVTYMLEGGAEVAQLEGGVMEYTNGSGMRLPGGSYRTTSGETLEVDETGVLVRMLPAGAEAVAEAQAKDDKEETEQAIQERIRAEQRKLLALRQKQQKTPAVKDPLPQAVGGGSTQPQSRGQQFLTRLEQLRANPAEAQRVRETYNPTVRPKRK